MPLRTLFNEERKFTIASATRMLWTELNTLFPSVTDKSAALQLLIGSRFGQITAVIEAAKQNGFEPGELEGKVGPVPAHGNAAGNITTDREALVTTPFPKRPLQKLGLVEELYQLEKRKKSFDLFQQANVRKPEPPQSEPRT